MPSFAGPRNRLPPGVGPNGEVGPDPFSGMPLPAPLPPAAPPSPRENPTPPDTGGGPPPPMGDTTTPGLPLGTPDLPPAPLPPAPSNNSPLALPGSFAQPGTPQAVPFRSPQFLQGRVIGPTGPGAPIFGGLPGFSGIDAGNPDEEFIRRIVSGLRR
jgi:hypothetical protein